MHYNTFVLPILCASSFTLSAQEAASLTEEIWIGVNDEGIESIIFQKPASSVQTIAKNLELESTAEHYGARYMALLSPPETGEYTFWVSGDDYASLALAPDDKDNQLKTLCKTANYTPRKGFNASAEQKSSPVHLEKGKQYCLRLLHAQGVKDGHVAVAWQGPGMKDRQIIDSKYLRPFSSPRMDELKHQIKRHVEQKNDLITRISAMNADEFNTFCKSASPEEQNLLGEALTETLGKLYFLSDKEKTATLKKYANLATLIKIDPSTPETSPLAISLLFFESAYLNALSIEALAALGPNRNASLLGNIASLEPPSTHKVKLSSNTNKQGNELLSTGFYAAPGKIVEITLPPAWVGKNIQATIGHHRNLDKANTLKSPPVSTRSFALNQPTTKIINPYGGIIYLEIPRDLGGENLEVICSNVYKCPQFTLGKDTNETWKTLRQNPAPWGELRADNIIITLPRAALQAISDPEALMKFWQKNTALHEQFYNYNPGYPFQLKICHNAIEGVSYWPLEVDINNVNEITDINLLKKYNYPYFLHEHGHHTDDNRMVFDNASEATCNWGGYAMKKKMPMDWKFTDVQNIHFLFDPRMAGFQRVREPGWTGKGGPHSFSHGMSAVMSTYAYDFGWDAIEKVVHRLTTDTDEMYQWAFTGNKTDHQAKLDRWIIGLSQEAKRDVRPFYAQFDLKTSPEANSFLDGLKLPEWNRTSSEYLPIPKHGAVIVIKNAQGEPLSATTSSSLSGSVPANTEAWSLNSYLFPKTSGQYTLCVKTNGPTKIWLSPHEGINAATVIGNITAKEGGSLEIPVNLGADTLRYLRAGAAAPCTSVDITWKTANSAQEAIPAACIVPAYEESVQCILLDNKNPKPKAQ